jgi:hypothetical protein
MPRASSLGRLVQPRQTVEPDTGVAERLGPRELAGMPLDEGLGLTYLLLSE